MTRVVIAAGGTAGHVVPALAVADALRDRSAEVSFAGTAERAEATLVPAAGYELDALRVRGLDRRNPIRAAGAAILAGRAVAAARGILRRRAVDVVVGAGGYVAGPVGLAATMARVPIVLMEADSHLGLANRMLSGRARRVCLAFPIAGREGERFLVTGRPVPRAVLDADRSAARARFGIDADAPCALVFGGSLGARTINDAAAEAFAEGERDFWVLHICGRRDYESIAARLDGAPRYVLVAYEPHLGDALAAADLVVARAGGSIFEIAAAGRPAILVPYPHATADHQRTNAEWMSDAGAAVVLDDAGLDAKSLREAVEPLIAEPGRLAAMAEAARRLAMPDAAERIADEVMEAAT